MKYRFLAIPLLFFLFSFFFLIPKKAIAASCDSQNGYCTVLLLGAQCPNGSPITNNNCLPLFTCCPLSGTASCASLDGYCSLLVGGAQCPNGSPIANNSCLVTMTCCPKVSVPTDTSHFCDGIESHGINTALGCIKVTGENAGVGLITTILKIATGLGGGIALALILYGTFIVTTSAGMPDKLKVGSEIITSAIIGLIFILLSVFLVNLIGINILGIPGLT